LERSVIGLARINQKNDVAALWPLTEELVQTGAWTYALLSPFHTIAGIAAAYAGDWASAERHHVIAIQQTDSAPYLHLQPVAREWYALMLLERNRPSDNARAKELLSDAITIYQSTKMPFRANRAKETRANL